MIISHIIGGLGNQMFQYAAGRAFADSRNTQLKLDLSDMAGYQLRSYALDQFAIRAEIADPTEIPARKPKGLKAKLGQLRGRHKSQTVRYVEPSLRFDPEVRELPEPVHLTGYFQSERYFNDFAAEIRRDFALAQPFTAERQQVFDAIRTASKPVSVHVRRGDYVSNAHANSVHGTCEPAWYDMAIAQMIESLPDATFFLFSDDPQWAKDNIAFPRPVTLVEPGSDGRDAQDMQLMAACHSHIVANSSFSWWGAWLNPNPEKRVIAPKQWFRSKEMDATDLVPESWKRV